jgi:endonuclease YncB( thermonuclease family)
MRSVLTRTIRLIAVFSLCVDGGTTTLGSSLPQATCSSETIESKLRVSMEGLVVRVLDERSLLLLLDDQTHLNVQLGGINTSKLSRAVRRQAQDALQSAALNKRAVVIVEAAPWVFKTPRPQNMIAVVTIGNDTNEDLSLTLIRMGMVRYTTPKAYSISGYRKCMYQNAEKEARAQKRGIWR